MHETYGVRLSSMIVRILSSMWARETRCYRSRAIMLGLLQVGIVAIEVGGSEVPHDFTAGDPARDDMAK